MVCWVSNPQQFSEHCWNQYVWEVCSANQWDALQTVMHIASISQPDGTFSATPDHVSHQQHVRRWMYWATKFCLICRIHLKSHQLTTISTSCLLFAGKNASTTNRMQKMLSKNLSDPEAWIFMPQEQTFFLLANVLIVMVPILICIWT